MKHFASHLTIKQHLLLGKSFVPKLDKLAAKWDQLHLLAVAENRMSFSDSLFQGDFVTHGFTLLLRIQLHRIQPVTNAHSKSSTTWTS